MSEMHSPPGKPRPTGISSRVTRAAGPRHPWAVGEFVIDLPLIVDWVSVDATGQEEVRIEATVDVVAESPQIVRMTFDAARGLDLSRLQRDFRWASPLEVVTGLMPALLDEGVNPFDEDLPLTGFPAAATALDRHGVLTDEFLITIAREYILRGRGYAASLAAEYNVSRRTVISWVEKARTRGLLTRPPGRGSVGGEIARGH